MMNTKEEQMRAEFEAHITEKYESRFFGTLMRSFGDPEIYLHEDIQMAWLAYQAALNSQAKSVPEDEAPNPKDYDRTTIDGEANYRLDEHSWKSKKSMLAAAPQPPQEDRVRELEKVFIEAKNLCDVKGRHHSEIAMKRLQKAIAAMKEPNTLEGEG